MKSRKSAIGSMVKGFTLIEVMVALSILVIISSFGVVNFMRTNRIKTVENAADRLRQAYVSAKSDALAGKKNCSVCGAPTGVCGSNPGGERPLLGWEVAFSPGNRAFRIQGVCGTTRDPNGSSTRFSMSGITVTPESLPSNLFYTITNTGYVDGGWPTVLFRSQGHGTYPGNVVTVTVSDASGTTRRGFTINGSGEVGPVNVL